MSNVAPARKSDFIGSFQCPVGIELPFVGPTMLGDVEQSWMKILNKIKPDPVSAKITQHNVQTILDYVGRTCWPCLNGALKLLAKLMAQCMIIQRNFRYEEI